MSDYYEIVIYTASIAKYATPLISKLDPLGCCSYHLFRNHCSVRNNTFVKDLSLLGRDLAKTMIIDNTPSAYALQPDNAIPIETWLGDPSDKRLFELIPILEILSGVNDVREHVRKIAENYKRSGIYSLLPTRSESTNKKMYKISNKPIDEIETPQRSFVRHIITKPIIVSPQSIKEDLNFPKVVVAKIMEPVTYSWRGDTKSTSLINLKVAPSISKPNIDIIKTIEPRAINNEEADIGKLSLALPKEVQVLKKNEPRQKNILRSNAGIFDIAAHNSRMKHSVKATCKTSTRLYTAETTSKDLITQIRHVGTIINKLYSPPSMKFISRSTKSRRILK